MCPWKHSDELTPIHRTDISRWCWCLPCGPSRFPAKGLVSCEVYTSRIRGLPMFSFYAASFFHMFVNMTDLRYNSGSSQSTHFQRAEK